MEEKISAHEYLFGLALFLLTSARGCVDEPLMYGPLRLLDAISRLVNLSKYGECIEEDPFLLKAKEKIDQNKYMVMSSEEKFVEFMDHLIREFTVELKRRYALE